MNKAEFSKLIMEHLYLKSKHYPQYFTGIGVSEDIAKLAEGKGLTVDRSRDERAFREAFWELASKNLVVQGCDAGNCKLPFVSITEYGAQCYREGKILPYDPENFLSSLYSGIPNLDEVIKLYFEEAVNCFSNMQYLSSTVMIGGALERTVLYLTDEVYKKLTIPVHQTDYKTKVLDKDKIKIKFDSFIKFVKDNNLDDGLGQTKKEKLHSMLPSIINLIRITRNETGHPTGREVERDEAQGNILLAKEAILFSYELLKAI